MSIIDPRIFSDGILDSFNPITLNEMDSVKLMNRTDTKFVFRVDFLEDFLNEIKENYRILIVDGNRISHYETLYFDTKDFHLFLDHHNGKANRFKVRYRSYSECNLTFFEIKIKNNKGRTHKVRIREKEVKYVIEGDCNALLNRYAPFPAEDLFPSLEVNFDRLTIVNKELTERVTLDMHLGFRNDILTKGYPGIVITEVKLDRSRHSGFIQLMHHHGIPEFRISKYCLGVSSLYDHIKKNNFKPKILQINKINQNALKTFSDCIPVSSVAFSGSSGFLTKV
ncbi:MAG: polyphosphate polymerase domain-containing protein [Bacteroidota bacterium]|nr:polyphosphate polymerase domain-containing protein [Bacteroidota bacterium]